MKNITLFLIIFCSIYSNSYSQVLINASEKYKQAGLIWGLLKYHHPDISAGKYDWDTAFVKLFDKLELVQNQVELNNLLFSFVEEYKTNMIKDNIVKADDLFLKNRDYSWIDKDVFGQNLTNLLLKIKNNKNIHNYYASTATLAKVVMFKNERGFEKFDYTIKSHRLLLFFSFWNAMEYWNVNKYLTDEDWLSILDYMPTNFANAKTQFNFEMAKLEMVSKLDDSHSDYGSRVVYDSIYKFKPSFQVKNINDSLVVNKIFNSSSARKDDIALGDIILKIKNRGISKSIDQYLSNTTSSSNSSFMRQFSYTMLYNSIDSLNVEILKKDGKIVNKFIHLSKEQILDEPTSLEVTNAEKWSFVKPNIAYIKLDEVTSKDLKEIFKKVGQTDGLVLDLRNYPKNISPDEIPKYTYPRKKSYSKNLYPVENMPSIGKFDNAGYLAKMLQENSIAGKNNPNYYKGKIVLLVNNKTQSHAETVGMAIQQSPNCITIGEQTAGAVRYVVTFTIPDKTKVSFTGLGAFYPNGVGVQREGLHIEYFVKESAQNYNPELYIIEAVRIIEER